MTSLMKATTVKDEPRDKLKHLKVVKYLVEEARAHVNAKDVVSRSAHINILQRNSHIWYSIFVYFINIIHWYGYSWVGRV